MTLILKELLNYLKNPVLETDQNQSCIYRFKVFFSLLFLSLSISFFLSIVTGILTFTGVLHENNHLTDSLLNDSNELKILFLASILAPIIEELIFRAPLVLFKQASVFKIAFYIITTIFAYVHIFNFEINDNVLLFSPLLVAPQFIIGLIFGFIRIRFGLIWAIGMHGTYNGILVVLFLLAKHGVE